LASGRLGGDLETGGLIHPGGIDEIDDVDARIIAALRSNGRIASRELARQVGVTEATIRTRLRRLEDSNVIRIAATRNLGALGYDCLAAVGVQVKGRSAVDVGADLARLEEVVTVNVAIGLHDIEIQVVAKDLAHLERLLTNVISHIPGVETLTPAIALKILKYNSGWAPL
jgi:Lrp/AsnC family transcriptional regulator for asnA, asnC and gidA